MQVRTFRDDAMAEVNARGKLLIRGVLVSHFIIPGRIAPLHTSTEIEFKPGILYKVYTGLSIGISDPANLNVRAVAPLFKQGVDVKRVEIEDHDEIVVFITTLLPFKFVKNEPMFEVSVYGGAQLLPGNIEIKAGQTAAMPGHFEKEAMHLKEVVPATVAAQQAPPTSPSDEKLVNDWLNSPDTKGKEVGVETNPAPMAYTGPASISNSGPNAESAVAAKLSGKLNRL